MSDIIDSYSDESIVDSGMENYSFQRLQEMAENHPWYMSMRRFLGISPKVSIRQFFQWYYDYKVFYKVADSASCHWDLALKFITRSDPALTDIDHACFSTEMKSMWLAMVGLALKHSLAERDMTVTKISFYILAEIIFTKNYLERNGHIDIWENTLVYNQVMGKNKPARHARCERYRRSLLKGINEDYVSYIENLYLAGRLDSTVRSLVGVSAEKLGWDVTNLNHDVLLDFEVVVLTHYGDAKGLLDLVSLRL